MDEAASVRTSTRTIRLGRCVRSATGHLILRGRASKYLPLVVACMDGFSSRQQKKRSFVSSLGWLISATAKQNYPEQSCTFISKINFIAAPQVEVFAVRSSSVQRGAGFIRCFVR